MAVTLEHLALATLGNIIGGALFVAGAYWMGSPKAQSAANLSSVSHQPAAVPVPSTNGIAPELEPVGAAR